MFYLANFESEIPRIDGLRLIGTVCQMSVVEIPDAMIEYFDTAKYSARQITAEEADIGFKAQGNVRGYIKESNQQDLNGGKIVINLTEQDYSNAISLMKKAAIMRVAIIFNQRYGVIRNEYNEIEAQTWVQQKAEADAYTADNTAATPLLSILAAQRGITVGELAAKVIEKADAYNTRIATLLGQQQAIVSRVNNAPDVRELNRIYEQLFGIWMPLAQAKEDGLVDENERRIVPVPIDITF